MQKMKREIAAATLFLLMIAGAWWNLHAVDRLSQDILDVLELSQDAAEQGDLAAAEEAFARGLKRWLDADNYTHIFIRHAEIDSTSDAFYELQDQLLSQEADSLPAAYEKLRYHLTSIQEMEHLNLGSIL